MPFRYLGVMVHEMGHGFGALLTGGRFLWFQMDFAGNGVAVTVGGSRAASLLMGLLGPAGMGALLLTASTREPLPKSAFILIFFFFTAATLWILRPLQPGLTAGISNSDWSFFYLLSVIWPILGIFLTYYAFQHERWGRLYLQIFGLILCFAAFSDTEYFLLYESFGDGMYSDVRVLAGLIIGGPENVPRIWFTIAALSVSLANFLFLFLGARQALKSQNQPEKTVKSKPLESLN